jgi:alginate O-acetyltransferase complex protein AlgI
MKCNCTKVLFNSLDFALFLPIVFSLYWLTVSYLPQRSNFVVLAASYLFYGMWDWRFLSLILFSTVLDYCLGIAISNQGQGHKRKRLLMLSVVANLGLLGVFKYYNFFMDSVQTAFSFAGRPFDFQALSIVLPVGISFYTFQTLSYTIDVYRRKMKPSHDFVAFASFVSFFPQLVAGPIERATNLLPQFYSPREFRYGQAVDGMRQILWGLFKKMVIADGCAKYVDIIFESPASHNSSALAIGAILFAFQIYGDFSGYSDIAIGTARLFGFDLMQNFAFPYFSRDIAEFWRRWHISLSTWFRDYLYIPLGGSRGSTVKQLRNIAIIFIVSGFWHGANFTFIAWGAFHAALFIPLLLANKNRVNLQIVSPDSNIPSFVDATKMISTFCLVSLGWILFRADSISIASSYIAGIPSPTLFDKPNFKEASGANALYILILFFLIIEWLGRRGQYAIEFINKKVQRKTRWVFYSFLIGLIGLFMKTEETPFIYFQF